MCHCLIAGAMHPIIHTIYTYNIHIHIYIHTYYIHTIYAFLNTKRDRGDVDQVDEFLRLVGSLKG